MTSIKDDRGYNQGFTLVESTEIRMKRRADFLLAEMELTSERKILEIGCGTGEISFWMAQKTAASVLGTDLCGPFIEHAKGKYTLANLEYDVLDFTRIEQFRGQKFDYIVGNGILHHLYNSLDEVLVSMRNLLNENGKIVFLEPNYLNPYIYLIFSYSWLRAKARLEPDEMAFTRRFVIKKLQSAGYVDIEVDYIDFLLPGIPRFLVGPSIILGNILERIPFVKLLSQSLFIRAKRG